MKKIDPRVLSNEKIKELIEKEELVLAEQDTREQFKLHVEELIGRYKDIISDKDIKRIAREVLK